MPGTLPVSSFKRAEYTCENIYSSAITEFKMGQAGLGYKVPRHGYPLKPFCPLCPTQEENSEIHLLFFCSAIAKTRSILGICRFIAVCQMKDLSIQDAFRYFLGGLDADGNPISKLEYLERGKCISSLKQEWLEKW